MFRLLAALVSISLIFALAACGAQSEQTETGSSGAPIPSTNTNPEMPITPKDTVARLLELAEAGDWETYVNDYYGEAHKFRDEGDRTVLVSRFRDDWALQVGRPVGPSD